MTALNKQALREEFLLMQDHYSDPADRERQVIYIAAEALLDELEKSQNWERQWKEAAERRGKRLTRQALEILKQEQRIAELEARTVNLPKQSVGEVMHMSGFSRDYAEGWCAGNDNAIHEIRAAGIGVRGD
ncbi:TPA: ead/Ea22-like family protein [Citrobacter freundii]|nr:ead/Ea22-like family protein [Citrobacter freundii]HCA0719003.1 ead/Ea22-like family protein [Citrobacter freundii]HCA1542888.1 ead/Ea22-like family protein [Citrobacter freundii]HCA2005421.1 ead/Ea22-like family protein [Citrobacter freundii]